MTVANMPLPAANAAVSQSPADTGDVDDAQLASLKKTADDLQAKAAAIGHSAQPGTPSGGWWSTHNAMTMSASVLIFGAVVIAIAAFSSRNRPTMDEALRLFGTIMVITMAVFLVVAGYDDKQIAAPLGLLGTIVGYLLGRGGKPDAGQPDPGNAGQTAKPGATPGEPVPAKTDTPKPAGG